MTNKEYLNQEENTERLKLFLYFNKRQMGTSMKKILIFLDSEVDLEVINLVKLYTKD